MESTDQLSLEQQFQQRQFSDQVRRLSPADAQDLLIELHRQMMVKDNVYQQLLKPSLTIN
ncbi:NblA/ycf18 family protein [filamentous cyanobacterium LEGE 11480]|uniref:NblA/ycf18 family protein n=1 Tax=Romeriopsis navalis LEGE 11480 TaxID=2777977 RepID=A0A928VPN1_9CYAN|nr:NblA/ycf18 family protein [Romeriopsis navalis]MBE9032473.1 NblA/ycf18 family protein [Romeriopsis navalis LEGE 11480]